MIELVEGVDYINVYSKSATEIGRALSNFHNTPIVHPKYGNFETIEGLWYWLKTRNDRLRYLPGWQVKKIGRVEENYYPEGFVEDIKLGLEEKFKNSSYIRNYFVNNPPIPLKHFYIRSDKIVSVNEHFWVIEWWQEKWEATYEDF